MPAPRPGRPTEAQAARAADLLAMDRRLIQWHPDGTASTLVGRIQLPLHLSTAGNLWVGTGRLILPDGRVLPDES